MIDGQGESASASAEVDERESIRGLVGAYIAMQRTTRLRVRPFAAALAGAAVIGLCFYVAAELAPIDGRQAIVLNTLVAEAAAETHVSEAQIWDRIADRTGARDPVSLKEWYYQDAIEICVDRIERGRLITGTPTPR